MYDLFFKMIQKIMWLLLVFWIFVAVMQLFALSWLMAIVFLAVVIYAFYHREKILRGFQWLMRYKKLLAIGAIIFQLAVILSANLLVRRDAAVVINGAFELIKDSSISNYLTRNPNNLSMFLYARSLYHLFGYKAIWVLQLLGMVYMNGTAWILYKTAQKYFNQTSADVAFTLYLLLLGFSPYVIQTYTDLTGLPFLALQTYLTMGIIKDKEVSIGKIATLGVVTTLALIFRPTGAISIIAFFILLFLEKSWKKLGQVVLIFGLSFGLTMGLNSYIKQQQTEVVIQQKEELAKSWLTFINLGLTYSGTDQTDMKNGLLQYIPESEWNNYNNGMFANENEIKEIKRRLSEYTVLSFSSHIVYKLGKTLYDGSLNWLYMSPEKEKSAFISPLYVYTKDNALAEWVRKFIIEYDSPSYVFYKIVKQPIWIVMVLGAFVPVWKYRRYRQLNYLLLTIFGGILFLMVFEGGKTRYLIQFLPQIFLLSSIGLATWLHQKKTE